MTIKDLPLDARPREKMLARGPAALSDVELLAILLRTGMAGKNVFQLAQELLNTFGGLSGLLNTGTDALAMIKGLGPAKRAELAAVLELSRRGLTEQLTHSTLHMRHTGGATDHDHALDVLYTEACIS